MRCWKRSTYRKPVLGESLLDFHLGHRTKGIQGDRHGRVPHTRTCWSTSGKVIGDEQYRQEMVDYNYELGKAFFSYSVLRRKLRSLITNFTGLDEL